MAPTTLGVDQEVYRVLVGDKGGTQPGDSRIWCGEGYVLPRLEYQGLRHDEEGEGLRRRGERRRVCATRVVRGEKNTH